MKRFLKVLVILIILNMIGCTPETPKLTPEDINNSIANVSSDDVSFFVYHRPDKNKNDALNDSAITDYKDARFLILSGTDQAKTDEVFRYFNYEYKWKDQSVNTTDNLYDAIESMKNRESDVLILPKEYIENLQSDEDERIKNYVNGFSSIYNYTNIDMDKYELIDKPFLFYAGGSDNRATELVENSRYDTDILLAVSPIHKQILIVSIPRDMRTPNPAHNNGDDKLTHLGDDGPQNILSGLNAVFKTDIKMYAITNFTEFIRFVDLLGGLDIYNPYTFKTVWKDTFYEGNLHLNGALALKYARERQNIPEGDIGRNKHQAILLKAMINKVLDFNSLEQFSNIVPEIQKSFMNNLDFEKVLTLAKWQLENDYSWTFFNKQIYGDIEFIWTATYNTTQQLGVINPHQSDIDEAIEMINTIMSGDALSE